MIQAASAEPRFRDEDQRLLYFWGTTFGKQLEAAGIGDRRDLRQILRGIEDAAAGDSMEFPDETQSLLNNMLVRRRKAAAGEESIAAQSYLRRMAQESGAVRTETGLVFRELVPGDGMRPGPEARVSVHYTGTLRDGRVFDSSIERGPPLRTALPSVIACWQEALPMMNAGGKAKFTCPPGLAYGMQGAGRIPGGAALTFELELLEVEE